MVYTKDTPRGAAVLPLLCLHLVCGLLGKVYFVCLLSCFLSFCLQACPRLSAELFCLLVVECFQEPVAPACCSRPRYDLPSKVFKERTLPSSRRPLSDTYSFVHQYLFCLALLCLVVVVKVNSSSLRFLDIHFLLPRVRRFYFNSQLSRPYTFPRNNNNIAIPNQVFHPNKQALDRVASPPLSQS